MAQVRRLLVLLVVAGWIVGAPAVAGAKDPLLAGGGSGGVCYEPPPTLGFGWVAVGDSCFSPQEIRVSTGETVRWSLTGQGPHNVTFEDGPYSGNIPADGFAVTFRAPGTYAYACSLHPGMTGVVHAMGDVLNGPSLEVVGAPGASAIGGTSAAGTTSVLRDSTPVRLEFSPLTAIVLLTVGLPLSLGTAARLVGLGTGAVRRPQPRR